MDGIAVPVVAGLAAGIMFIILFSTIGANAFLHYPRYDLGTKDELLSKLSGYFAREPDNDVRLTNESYYNASVAGGQDIYAYGLMANNDDFNPQGVLRIFTYPNEMRVHGISIEWEHDDDPALRDAGDLMVSWIADNTIPEWQDDDDQPNRNIEMLDWVDANAECSGNFVKDDFGQQRTLYLSACEDRFVLLVKIEP